MTVAYPQHGVSDLAVGVKNTVLHSPVQDPEILTLTWPDMRESFPCESTTITHGLCGGANTAEWVLRLTPCCAESARHGYTLACTSCKSAALGWPRSQCKWCQRGFTPASTAYSSIEPLGVA